MLASEIAIRIDNGRILCKIGAMVTDLIIRSSDDVRPLTTREVMRILDVSRFTLTKWIKAGKIKGQKAEGDTDPWEFDPLEVERLRVARIARFQREIDSISESVYEYLGGSVAE